MVNILAGRPSANPRQTQTAGEVVREKVWHWDKDVGGGSGMDGNLGGRWVEVERTAEVGGFCGRRGETYFRVEQEMVDGGKVWGDVSVPGGWA